MNPTSPKAYSPFKPTETSDYKEFKELALAFSARHQEYTQSMPCSTQSPAAPPTHPIQTRPNNWAFLRTESERYLTIFSSFSFQLVSFEWLRRAPSLLPSALTEKFFTSTAPIAGAAASLLTHMFIRTFNYDPKSEEKPPSFGENLNRSIKSMAHNLVFLRSVSTVFSTASTCISTVASYLGAQSFWAYAPVFLTVGPLSLALSAIGMTCLHSAIDKVGVYQAFSDLMDIITRSSIKEPTKEETQVDSQTLAMTQNLLIFINVMRSRY